MLLQIQDGAQALTLRGGLQKMAAEGVHANQRCNAAVCFWETAILHARYTFAGTFKAYFRGNGVNVVKIAPETALRLTLNDRIKAVVAKNHLERITPMERMACGGLAGASAQVTIITLTITGYLDKFLGMLIDMLPCTKRYFAQACAAMINVDKSGVSVSGNHIPHGASQDPPMCLLRRHV